MSTLVSKPGAEKQSGIIHRSRGGRGLEWASPMVSDSCAIHDIIPMIQNHLILSGINVSFSPL